MSMFHCPCCGQPWVGHLTACESPYSISPDGTLTAPNWPAALGEANAECNALRAENERLLAERDALRAEVERMREQRDMLEAALLAAKEE